MEGGMRIIKYLVFFFNLLFWLSGLALIVIGGVMFNKYGDYMRFSDTRYVNAAALIISVGIIAFIIGFLGCCGAIKDNYCMITTFAIFLGVIFILEITVGILGFVYKSKVEDVANDTFKRALRDYSSLEGAKDFYNWAQKEFKCCGYNSPTDWAKSKQRIPSSCCITDNDNSNCTTSGNVYATGCKSQFNNFVKDNLVVIGGVGISIALLELIGIIFACCLLRDIQGRYEVLL